MLSYVSHEIMAGKPALEGLPATFGTQEDCATLRIVCEDSRVGMQVELLYTVFHDTDAITRSVKVTNTGTEAFDLTKVYSACIDMDNRDYDMVSLHGSWARESAIFKERRWGMVSRMSAHSAGNPAIRTIRFSHLWTNIRHRSTAKSMR